MRKRKGLRHRLSVLALAAMIAGCPAGRIRALASETAQQESAQAYFSGQEAAEADPAEQKAAEEETSEREAAEADPAEQKAAEEETSEREAAEADPAEQEAAEHKTAETDPGEAESAEPVLDGEDSRRQNTAEDHPTQQENAETVTEERPEEAAVLPDQAAGNDELFADYLHRRLYGEPAGTAGGSKKKLRAATRPLTGLSADVYQAMLQKVAEAADGTADSSIFSVDIGSYLDQKSFTAEELGVDTIYKVTTEETLDENGKTQEKKTYSLSDEARKALYERIGWDARKVVDYLMTNCPYELYWYDKTVNYLHSLTVSYRPPEETVTIPDSARVRFFLPVIAEYAAEGTGSPSYTLNTDKTGAAGKVTEKAREIVAQAASLSDWEKLQAYRTAICELASYDYGAASDASHYGDPWQIIYVFDMDSSTKVVCEGYAKAFQYLCDLTSWNRKIECHTIQGTLGKESPVNHMWNVVSLWDGCNYAADLTNCDTGTPGYPDKLFMACTDDYESSGYTLMDGSAYYRLSSAMEALYTEESIRITSMDAHGPHYYEGMEPSFIWDEENRTCRVSVVCGLCGEEHCFDAEVHAAEGPEQGQMRYTAVFDAEGRTFSDTLIVQREKEPDEGGDKEEEDRPDDGSEEDETPSDGGKKDDAAESDDGKKDEAAEPDSGRKDDAAASDEETKESRDPDENGGGDHSPKVGDLRGEEVRNLIGTILLCLFGIAAVLLLLWQKRGRIREICTDDDGKLDVMGGLERHFTRSGAGAQETGQEELSPDGDFLARLYREEGEKMADLDPERDKIREHIIFHGRVQGVGFRYQAMYAARSFDLTGWVENLPDGSVEMEVQGTPAGIGNLLKHMQSGHWIRIDRMDTDMMPLVPGEKGFGVRGY